MTVSGLALLYVVVSGILQALFWVTLISALLTWVPAATRESGLLRGVERAMTAVVEPLLLPIRRRLPGGGAAIDFSPLVLMLLLQVAQYVVGRLLLA